MHGVRGCVCVFKCVFSPSAAWRTQRDMLPHTTFSLTNSHTQNGLRCARLLGAPRAAHEAEEAPLPQLEEVGLRVGAELVRLRRAARRRHPVVQVLAPRPVAHVALRQVDVRQVAADARLVAPGLGEGYRSPTLSSKRCQSRRKTCAFASQPARRRERVDDEAGAVRARVVEVEGGEVERPEQELEQRYSGWKTASHRKTCSRWTALPQPPAFDSPSCWRWRRSTSGPSGEPSERPWIRPRRTSTHPRSRRGRPTPAVCCDATAEATAASESRRGRHRRERGAADRQRGDCRQRVHLVELRSVRAWTADARPAGVRLPWELSTKRKRGGAGGSISWEMESSDVDALRAEALRALALRDHDWLLNARVATDFVADDLFSRLPEGWGDALLELATRSSQLRLRCRCRRAGPLRFARSSRRRAPSQSYRTKLWKILRQSMAPSRCRTRATWGRKRHECLAGAVHRARVCRHVCERRGRFGLGSGLLSHVLAFHHGLKVVGLEASEANAAGAATRAERVLAKMRPGRDAAADALTCVPCDSADETDVAEADGEGAAAHVASVSDGASGGSFGAGALEAGRHGPRRCSTRCGRRCGSGGSCSRPARVRRPVADAAALLRRGRCRR